MEKAYSVSEVNSYIKNIFVRDGVLRRICIKGEISNCKYHNSGHIYFSLKDDNSQMTCVMFRNDRTYGLDFDLKDGQSVEVSGEISVYEKGGTYSLHAKNIVLGGIGILYAKYEALKKKLDEEGLFGEEHKKPLPPYIKRLGIVTAGTGAALRDIMNITKRRNPYVQMILAPAQVQGAAAVPSIIKALEKLDRTGVDVIIVGRGGGSIEDLWAFNDETLARTVYNLNTPVISAVGHETDTTIIDYVSDRRAPTPSAAAEIAVYEYSRLQERLVDLHYELFSSMNDRLERTRTQLEHCNEMLESRSPRTRINRYNIELDRLADRLSEFMHGRLEDIKRETETMPARLDELVNRALSNTKNMLRLNEAQLRAHSPLEKINKGYAYVSKNDKAVKSVADLKVDDRLQLVFKDGYANCRVIDKQIDSRFEGV